MKFSFFSAPDLQSHKTVVLKDGWQINYLAFSDEKVSHVSPLVILGGAFQKFHSFKKEVEILCKHMPVILVDLPGQGSNNQIADGLGFTEYADILADFLTEIKVPKVTPVALSYGSAIGFTFAGKYPEKTDRLILGGTTPQLRKSVRILLEESLVALDENRMNDFATGVILNLFNYSQRKRTKVPRLVIRGFHKSLLNLSEEDKERYRSNTQRLLDLHGLEGEAPQCETLVIAGEYDNFTTPTECLAVANQCSKSQVAILRNCDHLAPFVKKSLMIQTYLDFALKGTVREDEGISLYNLNEIPMEKKILEPRWSYQGPAVLTNANKDWRKEVKVVDLNSYGICIDISNDFLKEANLRDLRIELPKEDLELETIFFDSGRKGLRGIFKRYDFDTYEKVEKFIKKLGDQACVFTPAPL